MSKGKTSGDITIVEEIIKQLVDDLAGGTADRYELAEFPEKLGYRKVANTLT